MFFQVSRTTIETFSVEADNAQAANEMSDNDKLGEPVRFKRFVDVREDRPAARAAIAAEAAKAKPE